MVLTITINDLCEEFSRTKHWFYAQSKDIYFNLSLSHEFTLSLTTKDLVDDNPATSAQRIDVKCLTENKK